MDHEQPEPTPEDHRIRVAAERRERMRARLVESALVVFGQHGPDASIIDELIRTAGVSRGTFYNYFSTNEDLLVAVSVAISNEVMRAVDRLVQAEEDPAVRIGNGIRLFLGLAHEFPALGTFLSRGGLRVLTENTLIKEYLPRDLRKGRATRRFRITNVDLAFDMVVGSTLAALHRMQSGPLPAAYAGQLVAGILRALGLPSAAAETLARRPLAKPELPLDSLLARASAKGSVRLPEMRE